MVVKNEMGGRRKALKEGDQLQRSGLPILTGGK